MGPRGWSLVKDDTKAAGYGDSNTAAGTRGTGAEGLGPRGWGLLSGPIARQRRQRLRRGSGAMLR